MTATRVVSRSEIWTPQSLCYHSLLLSIVMLPIYLLIASAAHTIVGMLMNGPLPLWLIGAFTVGSWFVLPLLLLYRKRFQIVSSRRAIAAGMSFGAGVAVAPLIIACVFFLQENDTVFLLMFLSCPGLIALYGMMGCLAWVAVKNLPDSVVVQDGTRCPGCAYCLIGASDTICPECGRRFTFAELETTAEAFRGRTALPV